MASIYDIKPRFQKLLIPIMKIMVSHNITPNVVTYVALAGSFIVGLIAILTAGSIAWLWIFPAWLFIRMALNAIDGMMAREFHLESIKGAVLNEIGDVLSDMMVYLPLAYNKEIGLQIAVVSFVIIAILTEFCGVLGQALGAGRRYEGPMGKSDRAFLIGAITLLTIFFPLLTNWWWLIFSVGSLLAILTCANRLKYIIYFRNTR